MAFTSDARVQLAERQFYYPDVTVACGEEPGTTLTNPVVVIEVLSSATMKRDRGAKLWRRDFSALYSDLIFVKDQTRTGLHPSG